MVHGVMTYPPCAMDNVVPAAINGSYNETLLSKLDLSGFSDQKKVVNRALGQTEQFRCWRSIWM